MDKFRKVLKNLFAPAIVLLLVAVMGVLSPAVSVAAALRVNIAAGVETERDYAISNLPARTVEVGTMIVSGDLPSVSSGSVTLCHAGKESTVTGDYTYKEVGQYEWRFYTTEGVLFDTYTVTVTDATYSMTMPSNVPTVAPKGLNKLELPLPSTYVIDGETMEVDEITPSTNQDYAVVTFEDSQDEYRLSAKVALANDTLSTNITADNLAIDLTNRGTGTLKVTYLLSDKDGKLLKALPLSDIEIKNVAASEVTFANIPTAPSVASLSYYSTVALTAPSADSAKTDTTSFAVEANTSIVKVQAYLYSTEPSSWTNTSNVITLTLNNDGTWTSSNSNYSASDLIEIDELSVKIKALGYYRFQFKTSTLFGYKMDDDFDNYDAIEQDDNKTYVCYWSDSVRIYRDSVEPNFAWVANYALTKDEKGNVTGYTATVDGKAVDYDEDFYDYLNTYDKYLPMTEKPDSTTTKKITVNPSQGLVLPAIFPHDNATSFANMKVTAFNIDQIQDANGESVSDNYAWKGDSLTSTTFTYDMSKAVKVKFTDAGIGSDTQSENEITLKATAGLYRVRVVVEEDQPKFLGDNSKYSGGYAQTKTKYLYFYLASNNEFKCGAAADNDGNSPVVDESNVLQVSDVYLWEGHTFDFPTPTFSDAHTPTDSIQVDYYLVRDNGTENIVIAKLDYVSGASRITVDLDNLKGENGNKVTFDYTSLNDTFYVYAVARNFNGMQANLKYDIASTDSEVANEEHFSTELFKYAKYGNTNEIAQYGYAWKRAAFKINAVAAVNSATTPIAVSVDAGSDFKTGSAVHINSIATTWSSAIDGQMSAAVYLVKDKDNNVLVPVDLKDDETKSANVVSSWAFNRKSYTVNNLYFTPGVSGEYILVVTAKEHSSSAIYAHTTTIMIDNNGEIGVRPRPTSLSTAASETVDKSIGLDATLTLPEYDLTDSEGKLLYASRNRVLYKYDADENLTGAVAGDYTITVMGITDPNCITGNKFTPSNYGKYKFLYTFNINDGSVNEEKTVTYVVQVNNTTSATSILMGEDYDASKILENVTPVAAGDDTITVGNGTNTFTYVLGDDSTGTSDKPAYAITLDQFTLANYGAATDFVVDSASLFDYLEPIYDGSKITGYMYPAIAIPMPNVVTDVTSSDEVEITVQKSGSTTYLVSSKKLNAGNSTNSASVIGKIKDYYVFRPEGTFSADCKDAYDENTYLQAAVKTSSTAGVYTVTYKTSDTSVAYNVTFGDLENGAISWNEGFLTYNNGSKDVEITAASDELVIDKDSDGHRYVTIDMTKVYFTGNSDMEALIAKGPNGDGTTTGYVSENADAATEYYWNKVSVTVSYEDGTFISSSTWSTDDDEENAIKNHENYTYKFDLNQGSGTYKVTITMTNSYTSSSVSSSLEFTLDAEATNKNINLNTVWGIILIVLSVGLLAGVIFYFVKTARATRFVDTPRAPKAKRVKQQDTKAVEAPKNVEATKKDAE